MGDLHTRASLTRDDAEYWDAMPADDNHVGLYRFGPQEARPAWPRELKTGNEHRTHETRAAAIAQQAIRRKWRMELLERQRNFVRAVTGPSDRRPFVRRGLR